MHGVSTMSDMSSTPGAVFALLAETAYDQYRRDDTVEHLISWVRAELLATEQNGQVLTLRRSIPAALSESEKLSLEQQAASLRAQRRRLSAFG